MKSSCLAWIACCAIALSASAAELRIAVEQTDAVRSVKIKGPDAVPGEKILLKFDAGLVTPSPSGWSVGGMELKLNGQQVLPKNPKGQTRLLGRNTHFQTTNHPGKAPFWGRRGPAGTPMALVVFASNEALNWIDPRILPAEDRAKFLHYELDVSDLTVPDTENDLQVTLKLRTSDFKKIVPQLVIKNIQLEKQGTGVRKAARAGKMDYPAVWPKDKRVVFVPGNKPVSKELKFPAVKADSDKAVVLCFNARIQVPEHSGWNPYLQIKLNGKYLDRMTADGHYRLLRRSESVKTSYAREKMLKMWNSRNHPTLLCYFAPMETEEMDSRILTDRSEGYNYFLDVSDIVHRLVIGNDDRVEKQQENTLDLTYTLTVAKPSGMPLVIQDMNLLLVPRADLVKLGGIRMTEWKPGIKAAELKAADGSVLKISKNGGLELVQNGDSFFINSEFSYPARPAMNFNTFCQDSSTGENGWKPDVSKISADTVEIRAKAKNYELIRRIVSGTHFTITDRVRNLSGTDIGMAWRIHAGTNSGDTQKNRLAGSTGLPGVEWHAASNPTLFIQGKNGSAGIIVDDTVSRNQLSMTQTGNKMTFGSEGTGIRAGSEDVREWAVYPNGNGDYFQFINRLRKERNINFTIPGPFWFASRVPPTMSPKLISAGPWMDYVNHRNYPGADRALYRAKVEPLLRDLRKKFPGVKLLAMLETNLVAVDCRKEAWAKDLPQRTGPRDGANVLYGGWMSIEQTRKFDESGHPMKDAVIRNAKGQAMFDNFYPEKPFINLMVQPETGNGRYRLFLNQFDFALNQLGFDGVYIDQFQPAVIGGTRTDKWDGHTVTLNPDGTIASRSYSYAITGAKTRAELIRRVTGQGRILFTNGQAMSRDEQSAHYLAFQEMEGDRSNVMTFLKTKPPCSIFQTMSHLGCPIGLGLRAHRYCPRGTKPDRRAEVINKGVIWALRNGLLQVYYDDSAGNMPFEGPDAGSYAMAEHTFPFTPVELHEGYVIGKERTITAISGTYTVAGKQKPVLYHYNCRGIPYKNPAFAVTGTAGNWRVQVKLDDWNEVAILEVRP